VKPGLLRHTAAIIAAAFILQTLALRAEDFWKKKEPAQWTEPDARKMLSQSPWARRIKPKTLAALPTNAVPTNTLPTANTRPVVDRNGIVTRVPDPFPAAQMPNPATANSPNGILSRLSNTGVPIPCLAWGFGFPSMPSPTSDQCKAAWQSITAAKTTDLPKGSVIVLCESAAPVRAAKTRLGIDEKLTGQATDAVVFSVIGFPLFNNPAAPSFETMMKKSAMLIWMEKGEIHISPFAVTFIQTNESIIRFFFPRRPVLSGDHQLIFRFQMDTSLVEAQFDLRDLIYKGEPAL
jgi:hypothetical protein